MILDTLTLHDFGVYRGKHTIDLAPADAKRPIVLIGGLNGEGKTTILDALRLALYGKRAICSNRNGRAYEDFLASCIHHGNDGLNTAGVEVQFHRTADGRDEVYVVNRAWTRTASGVRERLSVLLNGEEDRLLSEMWDDRVEAFLPQEISRLFFFDGERIEALADVDAATDFLRTAIGGLLGLDLVTLLQADLKVLRRNQKLAMRNKAERERLQQAEQDIRQLQKRKQATVAERDVRYKAVEDNRGQFRDADKEYREMGGALYDNRNALESEKIAAEEQLRVLKGKCMILAASELPLALVKLLLRKVEQTASAEHAAELSRAMADELRVRDRDLLSLARKTASNEDWIRKIEAFMRKDQERRTKQAEATDAYLMLSQDTHESVKHLLSRGIERVTDEARTVIDAMAVVKERIRDAEAKLAMLPDSERIAEIIDRRTKLKVALLNAETHVAALDEEIATLSRMIEEQTNRIDHLLEQDADGEHEKAIAHRLVEYADKVSGTLDRFQEMFLERHLKGLALEIGDCFALLLRKKRLIESIRIDPKTLRVELIGGQGRIIPPEKLSAGERQLLAVSMVWGLSRASGRPIPAVIDTPLGRLDSTHRRHLVERYFPYASHQVILLSTDEEIDEAYHKALASRISREFRVCFDETTHSSRIEPGYFW